VNLQEKINQTAEHGTLVLDFNEYFGQIVINKAITIEGQGSTVCAKKGPVISINSQGVELRNLRVEVTSDAEHEGAVNENASLALRVKENIRVKSENIIVKGNVSGLSIEDGKWEYPDVLHLWPVVPNKKNYFAFDMNVPISCVSETDISDIKIVNPGIKIPGYNRIQIEVESLKEDTVLFGEIKIISNYLRRIIAVSGGSFGIPANLPNPDENRPVIVGKPIKAPNQPPTKTQVPSIPKPEPAQIKKIAIAAAVLLCIALALIFALLFFKSDGSGEKDGLKPTATLSRIADSYTEGDTVNLTATAKDDKCVTKLAFRIENSSVDESWEVKGQSVSQDYSFSTAGWTPGTYTYGLKAEDETGNSVEHSGTFIVKAKPDTSKPAGKITGIAAGYTQGDIISYTVQGNDNKSLKKMRFSVKENPAASKDWQPNGASANYTSSFPSKDWKPGTYTCSLIIEDSAGNSEECRQIFLLKEVQYGEVNIFTRPPAEMYIDGKSFGSTPVWKLRLPAGEKRIRFVNKSKDIDVEKRIVVKPDELVKERFELK